MSVDTPRHEEFRDDLAAYALGALSGPEAAKVETHLAECEGCSGYVRWLQPAVNLLPAGVEQLRPPERLRESLMATVSAELADEAAARQAAAPEPKRRGWSLGGFALRPATALAAIAVLAVGGVVGYAVSDGDGQRGLVEATAVGDATGGTLAATVEHGAGGDAILHVERAPMPKDGHLYQAWVSQDGEVEPLTSFEPGADGTAEAALGNTLEGADAVMVTEEPRPDLDQPTSAPILRANLG